MIRSIYGIIPRSYRRQSLRVVGAVFLRAILNFIGVTMLIPILALMLNVDNNSELVSWLNRVFAVEDRANLAIVVCGLSLGVIVAKNLLLLMLHRYERNYVFSLYRDLTRQLYLGYYSRGLNFIKANNSSVLTRNVNVVSLTFVTGVLRPILTIMGEALLLILICGALAIYSSRVALFVGVVFLPILAIVYLAFRRRLNALGASENEVQRAKGRIVSETYRGYADIEVGGAMPHMLRMFDSSVDEVVKLRKRHSTLSMLPSIFIEVGLVLGLVLIVLFSIDGSGNMGLMFGIYAVAAIRLIPAIRNMLTQWSTLRYNRHAVDTLKEAGVGEVTTDLVASDERMELREGIELRNVSFKFDDAQRPTIENLSFTIKRGERLGIRGASGVGKTTLFNLILGLYRPTSGVIIVDGLELTQERMAKWHNSIGYVSQSVFISDGTLAENIAFGVDEQNIDYRRVNEAIAQANLMEFVESLSKGINTPIGEQGSRISGGQRQRIGIARALYKGCDIMLFDEATSSLDEVCEESINESITRLKEQNPNLTIVVIAHRESTLEYCDRVITLE